jgi:hypothetical protein
MSFSTGTKRRLVTLCVNTYECKCMCVKVCVGGVGWEGVCVWGCFWVCVFQNRYRKLFFRSAAPYNKSAFVRTRMKLEILELVL